MEEVYLKYKTQLDNAFSNRALSGIDHRGLMEILNAVEKKLGKRVPISMSCGQCIMNLIDLFMNLKNKE